MIRNLKVLGLALVAMLAMTAVAASAASADDLTSETSPVTMTGKQSGAGDVFTTTAGTVKCKEVIYTTASTATPTTTVTATPSYPAKTAGGEQNCTGFGFPAEVNANGCKYVFTIGVGTTGDLKVECAESKEITVTAASGGTTKCIVHVPGQTLLGAITYGNTGAGTTRELTIGANIVEGLSYKHTAGTGIGACTSGSSLKGSYTGAGTVTAENAGGAHVGIFLS